MSFSCSVRLYIEFELSSQSVCYILAIQSECMLYINKLSNQIVCFVSAIQSDPAKRSANGASTEDSQVQPSVCV